MNSVQAVKQSRRSWRRSTTHANENIPGAFRPSQEARLNVLLLCDQRARHIGTVEDHVQAFLTRSRHNVVALDARGAATIDIDFDRFDVVVTHYSVAIGYPGHVPEPLAAKIRAFEGAKIAFLQDEYRWIDASAGAIRDLGINVLFTVTNPEITRKIYRHPWFDQIRIEHTLTGFCPETLLDRTVPAYHARRIDVGYRARKVPNWLGSASQEKWTIGERFRADAPAHGLSVDISSREQDRLYGDAWIDFLSNCKAVLGTESSISAFDFDGGLKERIEAYERDHPEVTFEELKARFLEGIDGMHGVISVVSPRVFEAAALKTLMILYPGRYSDVLEPWRHYVPLQRDHGNMAEVSEVLKDQDRVSEITERSYQEVARSERWGYNGFAAHFDRTIDEVARVRTTMPLVTSDVARWQRQIEAKLRSEQRRIALGQLVVKSSWFVVVCINRFLPAPIARRVAPIGRLFYRGMRHVARRAILPRTV